MFRKSKELPISDTLKRKVVMVSIYYYGDEPITDKDSEVDWDKNEWDIPDDIWFLNDAIRDTLIEHNSPEQIFDVAIDHVKPVLHSKPISKWFYKLIRA